MKGVSDPFRFRFFLTSKEVNHYDIKCDNILLDPLSETLPEDLFWNQPTNTPNFSLCLGGGVTYRDFSLQADFGESKIYTTEVEGFTARDRGTEFIKSPEMLVIAAASQKTSKTYDRRKKVVLHSNKI